MKSISFVALLLLIVSSGSWAQKEITLDEAVSQQYRKFAADNLYGFSWVPGTTEFAYLEGYRTIKKGFAKKPEARTVLTIEEFNKNTKLNFNWFSGLQWISSDQFSVNDGTTFIIYDIPSKMIKEQIVLPGDAENASFDIISRNVAYTRNNNLYIQTSYGQKIKVTLNENPNIVAGQSIARSEFGIKNGIFWAPHTGAIAFYQKDESEVSDYPLLDIEETPGKLKNIKYPMAGQGSERAKVGVYFFDSRISLFISPRNGDYNYLTNVSWTPDGKYLMIAEVARDQNQMWLDLYEARTGNYVKTLIEEKNDKWVEPEHPAFFPLKTSNSFVWMSEKDGFMNLYFYNMDGTLLKKLTQNKFVAKSIIGYADGYVYFEATGPNPLNTLIYRVDLNGKQELVTPEEGTHHLELSSDGKFLYDQFSSHSVPGKAFIIDHKLKKRTEILNSANKYEGYDIGTAELHTLTAEDGSTLYSRLIKPKDFDSTKKYPVLVYVYGGPHAQMVTNSWSYGASLWMHWLAQQGYLVYTLDNRGSAHRGFAFESQIHRQLGTLELADQLRGVSFLKSLPYVDSTRLAVHGWSFGGFMTSSLMLRSPGVFNVGVAGGPVTDWKFYEVMYGERYMDRPEENQEGYKNASLFSHTQNLQGKLLLIHGGMDDVVVMQHSLALIKQFIEQGIQMDFFIYPTHLHNVSGKDRIHLMRKVLTYIIEHNE